MKFLRPNKCFICREKIPRSSSKLILHELNRYKPWEVGQFQQILEKLCRGKMKQLTSAICYRCFMSKIIGREQDE
jgi:hypothetical protein